jgi:ligand-binding sensor domain-containing protein
MRAFALSLLGLVFCSAAAYAQQQAGASAVKRTGNFHVVDTFDVGKDVYVRAITPERGKNSMWVGTSVGAHEIDLGTLQVKNTFTRKDGLANEYVFAIGLDRQDYKWFGTNAGGASRYKDGKWRTFFPMHGLADYWVYAFATQKNGSLWIGTWAGANRVDAKTGEFTTYAKELVNEWVYAIAVDSQDRVWFGTEGGVSMYDGKQWRSWTQKDGLGAPNTKNLPLSPNTGLGTRSRHDLSTSIQGEATYNPNYVFAIHVAPDDTIWAGTWGGGVAHFDGRSWTAFTTLDGLAGDLVFSISQDKEGDLWFGTDNGVSRYDGKTWQNFGARDGLLANHVYAIAAAPNGDIWVGSKGGVTRIAR